MFTDLEKKIYNVFLKESRSAKGLPYRAAKNFTKINQTKTLCLKKLGVFFEKHSNININEFFKAAFFVYPNDKYINLQFFTTLKAIKAYKIYKESPNNS